jgi:serine/threonine protein kinase
MNSSVVFPASDAANDAPGPEWTSTMGSAVASASASEQGMGSGVRTDGDSSIPVVVVPSTPRPTLIPYVPTPIIVIKGTAYHRCDVATTESGVPKGGFGAVYRVCDPTDATHTFMLKCPGYVNKRDQFDALRCEFELYGRLGVGNEYIAGVIHYELIPVTLDGIIYDVPHLLMMCAEYGCLQDFLKLGDTGRRAFFDVHPTIPTQLSAAQYCCRVFDIMMQVACGLSLTHFNGVIHADIKPLNILVTAINDFDPDAINDMVFYNVAICDFGCSVGTKTGSDMTPHGTEKYRAPEQRSIGIRKEVTNKTDVFTLAKVIDQLLQQSY